MNISNGVLLSVSAADLDNAGALRIPDGVTQIAGGVGDNLSGVRMIYFPDSVTEIARPCFCNNPDLDTIYFGEGMKVLTAHAFGACPNIKTIRIPQSCTRLNPWFEMSQAKLKTVIRRDEHGNLREYPVRRYYGQYYYETAPRQINNVRFAKICRLEFDADGLIQRYKIRISTGTRGETFVGDNITAAVKDCRQYYLMQEFERAVWEYNAARRVNDTLEKYQSILRGAIKRTLYQTPRRIGVPERNMIRAHIKKLGDYIKYLNAFYKKYENAAGTMAELDDINIDVLARIITPIPRGHAVGISCTRWLRRHPVSAHEMYSIVNAGYRNPGAFPYSWLREIPKDKRGAVTRQLHKLLRAATIKMYGPDEVQIQSRRYVAETNALADKISNIIGQSVEIKYLSSGNFSKTYTIQIPGDKKYVWKIYHCDRTAQIVNAYHHDTELQNSFLVGGKKYYGKTKFRKISTAGIGRQRGEIYLIYPYTDDAPARDRIYRPFEEIRPYRLIDRNSDNFLGHTVIDVGALRINYDRWAQPRYVSKIMNTVLYQSWNELGYVLNNYTDAQIHTALDFISDRVSRNSLEFDRVRTKIDFLKRKTRAR